jgi:hypothetical protein
MTLADRIRPFTKSTSERDDRSSNLAYVPKRILLGWVTEAEELEEMRQRALDLASVVEQAQRVLASTLEKSEALEKRLEQACNDLAALKK